MPSIEHRENEELLSAIENIFHELPIAYKRYATFEDYILVLNGIKPSTDFSFPGGTYDEIEFQKFKKVFEKNGLRFSEIKIETNRRYGLRRYGLIYNPEALKQQTANSKLAPSYNGQMDIDDYIDQSTKKGYHPEAIAGKLFGFPESAIKDFLKRFKFEKVFALLEYLNLAKINTMTRGEEIYWFYNKPENDVIEHERNKIELFEFLKYNPRFQTIIEGDDLKKSDEEWSRRLSPQA